MTDRIARNVAQRHTRVSMDEDLYTRKVKDRVQTLVEQQIRGKGKVIEIVAYPHSKGGGWVAIVDTEYAALKIYYEWRNSSPRLSKKGSHWIVAVS